MKRLIILIFASLLLLLTGCTSVNFPRLVYQPTIWRMDNDYIPLQEGYILDDGYRYDIIETEDGYDLVLHFVEEVE